MEKSRKISLPHPAVFVLLALILFLSLDLRTRKLVESPGWFVDEGTYLEVSTRIGNAQLQLGAVNITFVGPHMTHPPLYFAIASIFLKLAQTDMYSFRLFNALIGVMSCLFIFLLGRETGLIERPGERSRLWAEALGLIAAFIFAIHPHAVMYNRMGLPYNLYLLEAVIIAWFALIYIRKRDFPYCLAACAMAAVALVTVYYSVVFIPFLFLVILLKGKKKHLWALIIIPLPLMIFLGFMYISRVPGFIDDIKALTSAAGTGSLYTTFYHYHEFFQTGITYFLGLAGLFLLRRKHAGWFLFLLYFLMIHIVLRRQDTIIRFVHYPVIPVLPLVAVGCAAIVLWGWRGLMRASPEALVLITCLLGAYLAWGQVHHGIYGEFQTPLRFGMTKNIQDTLETGNFLEKNTDEDDLVLSTPTLWNLFEARNADLVQALVFKGKKVGFYKHHFPRERFLFSPEIESADYIVLDSFTDEWKKSPSDSPHGPLREAILEIEKNCNFVFSSGEYRVYANPSIN